MLSVLRRLGLVLLILAAIAVGTIGARWASDARGQPPIDVAVQPTLQGAKIHPDGFVVLNDVSFK